MITGVQLKPISLFLLSISSNFHIYTIGSGLILSNLPSIIRHFYDVDPDRLIEGILEYLPTLPIPDPSLQKYSFALQTLIEYSNVRETARRTYVL